MNQSTNNSSKEQYGKTILVTWANTGLGSETSLTRAREITVLVRSSKNKLTSDCISHHKGIINIDNQINKKNHNNYWKHNQSKVAGSVFVLELQQRIYQEILPLISTGEDLLMSKTKLFRYNLSEIREYDSHMTAVNGISTGMQLREYNVYECESTGKTYVNPVQVSIVPNARHEPGDKRLWEYILNGKPEFNLFE